MNVLIVVLLVVAALIVFKLYGLKHRVFSWLLIIVAGIFVLSVIYVFKANHVDVTSANGVLSAVKVYFNWLGNLVGNFGRVSGEVTNLNWGANSTIAG